MKTILIGVQKFKKEKDQENILSKKYISFTKKITENSKKDEYETDFLKMENNFLFTVINQVKKGLILKKCLQFFLFFVFLNLFFHLFFKPDIFSIIINSFSISLLIFSIFLNIKTQKTRNKTITLVLENDMFLFENYKKWEIENLSSTEKIHLEKIIPVSYNNVKRLYKKRL